MACEAIAWRRLRCSNRPNCQWAPIHHFTKPGEWFCRLTAVTWSRGALVIYASSRMSSGCLLNIRIKTVAWSLGFERFCSQFLRVAGLA